MAATRTTTFCWIDQDADAATTGSGKSSRAFRSAVQSVVQRGRPRKRASARAREKDQSTPTTKPDNSGLSTTLRVVPSAHPIDPFNAASITIDITAHGLLRYYVYYHHPAMWPNEKQGSAFESSVQTIVKTAVQDRLTMFCLLTAASARLQYVDRFQFPSVAKREALYTSNALVLMRREAGGMELKSLLQCIIFLTSAESYRDNFSAARMHLHAALALLEERVGGLRELEDEHLKQQLAMADLFLACVELRPCSYPCFYDPGPVTGLGLREEELMSQEAEETDSVWHGDVKDIVDVYDLKRRVKTSSMSPQRAFQVGQWITKRNMAIRHRLLASLGNGKDAVTTALVMWTLMAMNHTGRIKTVKIMARSLKFILQEEAVGDEDLRLWMLCVGFACSADGSEEQAWFRKEVGEVARLQILEGACLVEELVRVQKAHLYHALVQGPATQMLAREIDASTARASREQNGN